MYKLQMFDSTWLKFVGLIRRYWGFVFIVVFFVAFEASNALPPFLDILFVLAAVFGDAAFYFYAYNHSLQHLFMKANNLDMFFAKRRNTWKLVGPQFKSMKRSTFMGIKDYGIYGESLVGLPMPGGALIPLAFIKDSGCVGWIELGRDFPHLVVDSLKDRHSFNRLFTANDLPSKQVTLEGDFPESFKVFHELGQELMTMQILSPDRMSFLAHDIKNINLEIQDNYLRLYAANAQKSAREFEHFLKALTVMQKGLKTDRLSRIM